LGGSIQPGDDADAAAFFAPDDLPEIAFASTLAAIDQLKPNYQKKMLRRRSEHP
jgi:hypothetical protein